MQLKKIQTGVVYATHRSGEYNREYGNPLVVLDATVWEKTYGHSATTYRRSPSRTPGKRNSWSRTTYGLPAVKLNTSGDCDADTLEALLAVAKTVADQLAGLDNGPFAHEIPDVGGHSVTLELAVPREVQAEWSDYVTARTVRRDEHDKAQERSERLKRDRAARVENARARIAVVLPDDDVLACTGNYVPERPSLSWTELADLLDRYADARP